jgi:two-component system sensor kinase FixL
MLARAVENASDLIWFMDPENRFSQINDSRGRTIGFMGVAADLTNSPYSEDTGLATQLRRLEREILEISDRERRAFGNELHDGLGPLLTGLALRSEALENDLAAEGHPRAGEARGLAELIRMAVRQSRSLARGLAPIGMDAGDLVPVLRTLACETKEVFNVKCVFKCLDDRLLAGPHACFQLYRLVQEAVHNAVRHGRAGRIGISLSEQSNSLCLTIRDDGCGFHVAAATRTGMGLGIMKHRAGVIGAKLRITSSPGQGTEVECVATRAAAVDP